MVSFNTGDLAYSTSTKVYYENQELDVCVLINAADEDLVEGKYVINIFEGARTISTASLVLK
jgi:hypothetical protein